VRAFLIRGPSKLQLEQIESRPLVSNELRVKVMVTAVCGSDLKNIKKADQSGYQIPGHEFSGIVIESFDKKMLLGERVTAFPMFGCMTCDACNQREYRDCVNKFSLGFNLPGSFAEEIIVDARFVIPIGNTISFEEGALVEHLCCGLQVAKDVKLNSLPSAKILMLGDGPIALANVRYLLQFGFSNITVLGKHPNRIEYAKSIGAKHALNYSTFFQEQQLVATNYDIFIYSADDRGAVNVLLPYLAEGVNIYPQVRIEDESVNMLKRSHNAKIRRAFAYHIDDFAKVIYQIENGIVNVKSLITRRLAIDEVARDPHILFDKDNIKTVINFL